jgi:carbamoyltransferase
LISRFKEITGCPVIVNTSFNVRGEPLVCTPEDAFRCFMGTELDVLIIENFYLSKEFQNKNLEKDYKLSYDLD